VDILGITDPVFAVKRLCKELIDEVGFYGPPFKPEVLASFRGVKEIIRRPMRQAGRLIPLDDGYRIEVNSEHSQGKQRFSINHEVCHTFFADFSEPQIAVDSDTGTFDVKNEEEYLCDIGAAALLFDDRWFRPMASELGPTISAIEELTRKFEGSLEATARVWCELDLWPCCVVFWEKDLKPTQSAMRLQEALPGFEEVKDSLEEIRVQVSYHTSTFRQNLYLPKHKSVSRNGPVYACFTSGHPTEGYETFELNSSVSALWTRNEFVPYRRNGEARDRVISIMASARL
jgi:hypothetical protein